MPKVWTRRRAGTAAPPASAPPLVRNPVPERPQIHQIQLPLDWPPKSTEAYLIEGQPLTLIDTGVRSFESRVVLESGLEALGVGLADIERVVVTHAHREHFGLVESMRRAGAELECWVHESDAPVVERYSDVLRQRIVDSTALFREFGVPEPILQRMQDESLRTLARDDAEAEGTTVERRLRDGDRVEWKDWALKVVHSPGHTPGHVLLEDEELGLLFTGDQIMSQAVPHAETFYLDGLPEPSDPASRRPRFRGLAEMRASLRRTRERHYKVLLPGYGSAIRRADRAIRDTLLYYEVRLQRIDRGLRRLAAMGQDVTAFEIGKALFPVDESIDELRGHLLLLIGALDCLEDDGLLITERRPDGVLTHHHR